jgi:predicted ATPase/DNA-binding SARP family transcriptional activator
VEFGVLGPFQVRRGDGVLLAEGGGKRRALLAVLLLSSNRTVSPARLIEQLWGDAPPRSAANLVQGYVSDWRDLLDPGRAPRSSGERVLSTGAGYLLRVQPQELDLLRFSALAHEGRLAADADDLVGARRLLGRAAAERRGTALADFTGTPLATAAAGLEEDWLAVVELAAEVELRLGSPEWALAHVEAPARDHPLRETLTSLRMRSLYQLGRQADALTAYDAARAALAEELGVDPGPRLRQLHLDILRQAPVLDRATRAHRRSSKLPGRISSLVGRTEDVASIVDLVGTHRLVTLTGPGGSGKTRLAVEAAARIDEEGGCEVTFVDLAPVHDGELIGRAIAGALGRPLPDAPGTLEAVARSLSRRPALLVLDNLEAVTGAAPRLAALLRLAPAVRILATSREPLGVSGEQQMSVAPLATPDQEHDSERTAVLHSDAVRLFLDRARSCDPAFQVGDQDVPVIASIARRLDGLPLALELAAPWVMTLSLRALLERLDRPLALLADASSTERPDRHRNLRAALEWSYAALTDEQRRLLDHMSVFVSGARLEAIEAVTDLGDATLLRLAELVGKNLITRAGTADLPRYRLLETIREFAFEQLASRPAEQRAVADRHAAHVCALAESVARAARTRRGDAMVSRLDEEQDEIRAALDHLLATNAMEQRLSLLVDCLPLWWDLGHVREGHDRLTHALTDPAGLSDELCAAAHLAATVLAEAIGQPDRALELALAGGDLAQKAAVLPLEALSRCLEGNIVSWKDLSGDAAEGLAILQTARRLGETMSREPTRWGWSSRSAVLATAAISAVDVLRYRDSAQAQRVLASLIVSRAGDTDRHTESFILRASGALAADAGQWTRAEQLLLDSLTNATSFPSRRSESRSLEELARLAWARGDVAAAARRADRAISMSRDAGHAINWARCAALRADVALEEHDHERARLLLDDADTALVGGNPALAQRLVQPRRARLSRLQGNVALARRHLHVASVLERENGLTPDRVVHLTELATLARECGDTGRAVELADVLTEAASRVGITLPRPEQARLDAVCR